MGRPYRREASRVLPRTWRLFRDDGRDLQVVNSGPAPRGSPLFSRFRCSISSWSLTSVSECCCCRNCRLFSRSRIRFCASLSPSEGGCVPACCRPAGGRGRRRAAPREPGAAELRGRAPAASPAPLMKASPPLSTGCWSLAPGRRGNGRAGERGGRGAPWGGACAAFGRNQGS